MNNGYTGGPAFPVSADILSLPEPKALMGMTLRDYFAAKAMQSLLYVGAGKIGSPEGVEGLASASFIIADAMLRERAK